MIKVNRRFASAAMSYAIAALVVRGFLADLRAQASPVAGDSRLLTIDHYVQVTSTVPSISGQPVKLYVRERVDANAVRRGATLGDRVVLFVHGGGTPAEIAFDLGHQDYSWMAYLARAGFDVFALDFTGYGRSTRPPAMNDPCNLADQQQAALIPTRLPALCTPSYPYELTTMSSEWNDLGAVIDYVRTLRRVDRISLVAWSRGGPRAGGYAVQHPEKVQKLVLLGPRYPTPSGPPAKLPAPGVAMNIVSREEFTTEWDSQARCPNQYDPAVRDTIWSRLVASDSVGSSWGRGVRRAPLTTLWGWDAEAAGKLRLPTLVISGAHDNRVSGGRELHELLGSRQKVFIDLGCAGHNAMWEKNRVLLFRASLEWLLKGTVNGRQAGVLRMGY